VRPMASALINRMLPRRTAGQCCRLAGNGLKVQILPVYPRLHPNAADHLTDTPPEIEAPFSTPRACICLAAMGGYGDFNHPRMLESVTTLICAGMVRSSWRIITAVACLPAEGF